MFNLMAAAGGWRRLAAPGGEAAGGRRRWRLAPGSEGAGRRCVESDPVCIGPEGFRRVGHKAERNAEVSDCRKAGPTNAFITLDLFILICASCASVSQARCCIVWKFFLFMFLFLVDNRYSIWLLQLPRYVIRSLL